jgi:arsenate reductase-like glutaredoxin family protein
MMTKQSAVEAETMRKINEFIGELHRDIYKGYYEQKLTLDQLSNIMKMSRETIKDIIATYQRILDDGTIT